MIIKTSLLCLLMAAAAFALDPCKGEVKIFQFPPALMPHIDGKTDDWKIVGEPYSYRNDKLHGGAGGHPNGVDSKDLDAVVKVGWVKGLNRLYFLYEAYADYWDFNIYSDVRPYRYCLRKAGLKIGAENMVAMLDLVDHFGQLARQFPRQPRFTAELKDLVDGESGN